MYKKQNEFNLVDMLFCLENIIVSLRLDFFAFKTIKGIEYGEKQTIAVCLLGFGFVYGVVYDGDTIENPGNTFKGWTSRLRSLS